VEPQPPDERADFRAGARVVPRHGRDRGSWWERRRGFGLVLVADWFDADILPRLNWTTFLIKRLLAASEKVAMSVFEIVALRGLARQPVPG
jgi:hypothetical protein